MVQGTTAPRSALLENDCSDVLVMCLCRSPIQDSISCMFYISLLIYRTSNALKL